MKNRLIINFRAEDVFAGCKPRPVKYGTVDGKESVVVKATPGIICLFCATSDRCKENFIEVDTVLPSEVSRFSNS